MVLASTRPGDRCLDFFAGSGTLGAVARKLGRRYVLIDCNPEAVAVMRARLGAPGGKRADGTARGTSQTLASSAVAQSRV
jgi:site-specific DNA-methyltransferase (adenine-specific)